MKVINMIFDIIARLELYKQSLDTIFLQSKMDQPCKHMNSKGYIWKIMKLLK